MGDLAGTEMKSIITQMVGRELDELFPHVPHTPGEPILELEHFASGRRPSPASLVLRRGEILGIAGLVGAGRTTLLRAVFGLAPVVSGRSGSITFEGGYAAPRARIAQGVGFLSEDRKTEGLALSRSIEDNVTLFVAQAARSPRLAAAQGAAGRGGSLARAAARECDRPGARASRAFPEATSRRSRWRGCFTSRRTFCFSTSRPAASTSARRPRSIA